MGWFATGDPPVTLTFVTGTKHLTAHELMQILSWPRWCNLEVLEAAADAH